MTLTLKTGVIMLKIQLCHDRIKIYILIYSNRKELFYTSTGDHMSCVTHCSSLCSGASLSNGTATPWKWDCHVESASSAESLIR